MKKWLMFLFLMLLLPSCYDGPECEANQDCGDGKICRLWRCSTSCTQTSDCPDKHICTDGACLEASCSSSDYAGKKCDSLFPNSRGHCSKAGVCVECEDKYDCKAPEGKEAECQANKCVFAECFERYDCPTCSGLNTSTCIQNRCGCRPI